MFGLGDEKDKMSIPKNLDECTVTNTTARELWRVAETVESWGTIILFGIVFLGVISSFVTNSFINDITHDEGFSGFLVSIIIWSVVAVIEYIAYHLISLFIRANASVVQSNSVSAKVALYKASKNLDSVPSPREISKETTSTPNHSAFAKRINVENYSRNMDSPAVEPQQANTGDIICPKCGKTQKANRTVCWNCSQKFSQ